MCRMISGMIGCLKIPELWRLWICPVLWWIAGEDGIDRKIPANALGILALLEIPLGMLELEKVIPLTEIGVAVGAGCLYEGGAGWPPWYLWSALLPGLMMLAVSVLSENTLGRGDAYLFVALGFCLRPMEVLGICQISLLAGGIWGIGKSRYERRRSRMQTSDSIPLAPFVALGAGLIWLWNV